jgi:Family of unknown function (DUF6166)
MKIYRGRPTNDGCSVKVGNRRLPLRLDLRDDAASGFEWGYEGSGPAQLALAILADFLDDDPRAVRLHQAFMREIIGHLDAESWEMPEGTVAAWVLNSELQTAEFQPDLPFCVDGAARAIKAGDL